MPTRRPESPNGPFLAFNYWSAFFGTELGRLLRWRQLPGRNEVYQVDGPRREPPTGVERVRGERPVFLVGGENSFRIMYRHIVTLMADVWAFKQVEFWDRNLWLFERCLVPFFCSLGNSPALALMFPYRITLLDRLPSMWAKGARVVDDQTIWKPNEPVILPYANVRFSPAEQKRIALAYQHEDNDSDLRIVSVSERIEVMYVGPPHRVPQIFNRDIPQISTFKAHPADDQHLLDRAYVPSERKTYYGDHGIVAVAQVLFAKLEASGQVFELAFDFHAHNGSIHAITESLRSLEMFRLDRADHVAKFIGEGDSWAFIRNKDWN